MKIWTKNSDVNFRYDRLQMKQNESKHIKWPVFNTSRFKTMAMQISVSSIIKEILISILPKLL